MDRLTEEDILNIRKAAMYGEDVGAYLSAETAQRVCAEDVPRLCAEITALRNKVAMLEDESHAEAFGWITAERARQDQKWGYPQLNTYSEWAGILAEECGECCAELNELNFGRGDVVRLIAEAVQVAAVAVSIIEHLEPAQEVTIRMGEARVAAVEIDRDGLATAT